MNWSDIVHLMQSGDSVSTKFFKRIASPDDLAVAIAAFANSIGGTIVVGLDRINLHLVGSNIDLDTINLALSSVNPKVRIDVQTVEKSGQTVHVIRVEMGLHRPYVTQGKIFSLDESKAWSYRLTEEIAPATTHAATDKALSESPQSATFTVGDLSAIPLTLDGDRRSAEEVLESQQKFEVPMHADLDKLNARQSKALDYLQRNTTIQNKVYRQLFGVSHKTAHIELTDLVNRGELAVRGMGRSTHYVRPQRR